MKHKEDEMPSGWVKPQRPKTLSEVRALIAQKEQELFDLRQEAYNLENGPRLEAIARIRSIVKARGITEKELRGPCPARTWMRVAKGAQDDAADTESQELQTA